MDRRDFLKTIKKLGASGLLSSPLGAFAQYSSSPGLPASPTGIVILELANFFCSRCRAVNDQYPRIQQMAREKGFDLRFAPLAWEQQPLWPDRAYYAFRDLYPNAEHLARNALFEGIHREGMRFENLEQVLAYFERRKLTTPALELYKEFNYATLAERANSEAPLVAEAKASRLIGLSGADEVPVFLWVQGGDIVHAKSPAEVNGDPRALVQEVLRSILTPLQ